MMGVESNHSSDASHPEFDPEWFIFSEFSDD